MKKFQTPEAEVVKLAVEDVITASQETKDPDQGEEI